MSQGSLFDEPEAPKKEPRKRGKKKAGKEIPPELMLTVDFDDRPAPRPTVEPWEAHATDTPRVDERIAAYWKQMDERGWERALTFQVMDESLRSQEPPEGACWHCFDPANAKTSEGKHAPKPPVCKACQKALKIVREEWLRRRPAWKPIGKDTKPAKPVIVSEGPAK